MRLPLPDLIKPLIYSTLHKFPIIERRLLPSTGYRRLSYDQALDMQLEPAGWHNPSSATRQQRAYERLLEQLQNDHPRADMIVAAKAVDAAGLDRPNLIEVGCGGGYHSLIFRSLCHCSVRYRGSDYSSSMVEVASRRFPEESFEHADATRLAYTDKSFDIVFDGVALMHILDYRAAIAEAARVAKSHVIYHCVPLFDDHQTEYLFKYAYGEPVTESILNRHDFESSLLGAGLHIVESWHALSYDVHHVVGAHSHSRSYLCRKTDTFAKDQAT